MTLYLTAIALLLLSSGGFSIGGAIMSLLGWVFLIILLVLIWEYKLYIFLFIISVVAFFAVKTIISERKKYKDETPQQREERLKTNKMIEEWREKYR